MKITYIGHSGFCVEFDHAVCIFDYYEGEIPKLDLQKPIFIFVSHWHHDHLNFDVFQMTQKYPHTLWLFSDDIRKKYNRRYMKKQGLRKEDEEKLFFLKAQEQYCFSVFGSEEEIRVETLKSTDEGVAFVVNIEGKQIYHAGDLNWWTWDGETKEEYQAMTEAFWREMDCLKDRHFDVAFVPLDPRQGDKFYLGLDAFMRTTKTDAVYPMHFWKDSSVIGKIKQMKCSEAYRDKIKNTPAVKEENLE